MRDLEGRSMEMTWSEVSQEMPAQSQGSGVVDQVEGGGVRDLASLVMTDASSEEAAEEEERVVAIVRRRDMRSLRGCVSFSSIGGGGCYFYL